jgi:hypothetical protein
MRNVILAFALCAASSVGAQTPATTGPAQPPPPKSGGGGREFRVGGFMISGDRSFDFANTVSNETGSIQGIDVVLRSRAIGLQFKSLTGTFGSQPHVTSADLRLLVFPPIFSIMVGAGRRALWSELNASSPTQFNIGMAGVSSTVVIGGSGLRTNFSAAVYAPAQQKSQGTQGAPGGSAQFESGMEGEASVLYKLPKLPFFLQVGYRTEIFTAKSGTGTTPEEVRGIKLGGGMVFGGR